MVAKIHTKSGKMQFWGTSSSDPGTAFHEDCCECGCLYCTGGNPAAPSVTLGNFTNGYYCNCGPLNATHTTSETTPCDQYDKSSSLTFDHDGSAGCTNYYIKVQLISYGWTVTVRVSPSHGGTDVVVVYRWDNSGVAFDCTAQRTLTIQSVTGTDTGRCDNYANTTCQIN